MFTLVYFYVSIYVVNLILIFFFFYVHRMPSAIVQYNFTTLWALISKYFSQSWIFKALVFQLSGLPPVFFFLCKFNLLLNSLQYVNFFFFLFIFINLLLSMFFYLKVFFNTTGDLTNEQLAFLCANKAILDVQKKKYTNQIYCYYFICLVFIALNFAGLIFFLDFYFIFSNFCM